MKGSIVIRDKTGIDSIAAILSAWDWSKPLQIDVKVYRRKRTLSQNALFHKWMAELSEWLMAKGDNYKKWSPEFCKEMNKHTFLGYKEVEFIDVTTGEVTTRDQLIATSSLDTGKMTFFMELVYSYWAEKGCLFTIPEQSEYAEITRGMNK